MTQNDPVTRLLGYVLGPPIEWVGRRVERRVRRALPEPPAPPEPPAWSVPVVVAISFVVAVVVQLRADPDPGRSEPDRPEPEPEATAEEGHHPASEEDTDAVEEALETLNVDHPPVPEKSEVRARYRSLAVETHPDQGGEAERFIEVREAWETVAQEEGLSDDGQDVEVTNES